MRSFIFLLILLFSALFFNNAYSAPSVKDIEIQMAQAEKDKAKLPMLEKQLKEVVAIYPDSYKANYYLYQVLQAQNKPESNYYYKKSERLESENLFSKFSKFLLYVFNFVITISAIYFIYSFFAKKQEANNNLKKQQELNSRYLRKLNSAKDDVNLIILDISGHQNKDNNLVSEVKNLKSNIIDLIEAIIEEREWDVDDADYVLANVQQCMKHCGV